jgi:hypothetical protein
MGPRDGAGPRHRAFHVTIRDVDCADFDVPRFVADLLALHATFFSFFAGGYVTTYPTALKYQRISPWLKGRDLCGEIVEEAHRRGLRVMPMIDLGMVPAAAAADHPEWCATPADGRPEPVGEGIYRACCMGGYVRDYSREFVAELLGRYRVDAIKFGGGSLGFGKDVCHCPACRAGYRRDAGRDLPAARDWNDPAWHAYFEWRLRQTAEVLRHLTDMVHAFDPDILVTGNSVAFGDPHWAFNASMDLDRIVDAEDAAQVEVQGRLQIDRGNEWVAWQDIRWPAESASYLEGIAGPRYWLVASYFAAWPWRRSAAPHHEQKAYLALGAAHGASWMVNLSGGPPAVHEDRRGFRAVEEIYGFLERHAADLDGDGPAANVALLYSRDTLFHHAGAQPARYVDEIRGFERALFEAHIPFDIVSDTRLDDALLRRYRVLIAPDAAALSERAAAAIERFVDAGGALVASHETGLVRPDGSRRDDFLLGRLMGLRYRETRNVLDESRAEPQQAYWIRNGAHPLTDFCDAALIPAQGRYCVVETVAPGVEAPLVQGPAFRVFPEGLSYPVEPAPGHPALAVRRRPGGGSVVYFAGHIGLTYAQARLPDHAELIAGAVRRALGDDLPLVVDGPHTLHANLRRNGRNLAAHLVNLTGGERFFRGLVPLRGVRVGVRGAFARARLLAAGRTVATRREDGRSWIEIPEIADYEVAVFEEEPA